MSPYEATASQLVQAFSTTDARRALLRGLLAYRRALRDLGILYGHQWIDGSFLEDVESMRGRPPSDIDVVTVAYRPATHIQEHEWEALWESNANLFVPSASKEVYRCDAYYIDLNASAKFVSIATAYWIGLFSHQRETSTWKGMLQIDLQSDDDFAAELLDGMT